MDWPLISVTTVTSCKIVDGQALVVWPQYFFPSLNVRIGGLPPCCRGPAENSLKWPRHKKAFLAKLFPPPDSRRDAMSPSRWGKGGSRELRVRPKSYRMISSSPVAASRRRSGPPCRLFGASLLQTGTSRCSRGQVRKKPLSDAAHRSRLMTTLEPAATRPFGWLCPWPLCRPPPLAMRRIAARRASPIRSRTRP